MPYKISEAVIEDVLAFMELSGKDTAPRAKPRPVRHFWRFLFYCEDKVLSLTTPSIPKHQTNFDK
jgi:hypothetical protein